MASPGETTTPTKSNNKSEKSESATIILSDSEEDNETDNDKTIDLSSDEGFGISNGKNSSAHGDSDVPLKPAGDQQAKITNSPPTSDEVFAFVGKHNLREDVLSLEPPVKRPHSPEKLKSESVKRKCEELKASTQTMKLPVMSDSTGALEVSIGGSKRDDGPVMVGDIELPSTVSKLTSPNGGVVFLVGTAHFSKESQEDVAKVIQLIQPHIVTVELCKSRISLLQLDEETILSEAQNINLAKIRATVQQNGLFNGIMYILLLTMSAHLTKELGMAPGGEFRRAMTEAGKVPNCCVHLGDRPINITLHRALSSLSWWQTFKLTWHILTSKDHISKEEVEKCKQRDLLEEMLAEMTGEFPALSRVFVHERDLFLAHSLALATHPIPTPGGLVPARVVGVVGIGHVPGIIAHWGRVGEEDITPILLVPPPSMTSRVLRFTVKASVLGLVVWGAYKVLPVPRVSALPAIWSK